MTFSISSYLAACVLALAAINISGVASHGYMSYPPPRGIEKKDSDVDALKSPNVGGQLCRGEPPGIVTDIGHTVTLQFEIPAPHIGKCSVYILDENLSNPRKIADKDNCAAPGQTGPWTVNIPSDINGRKVLRWEWDAAQLVTTIEHYEQCADVNISG